MRWRTLALSAVVGVLALLTSHAGPAEAAQCNRTISTVPPIPGFAAQAGDSTFVADASGRILLPPTECSRGVSVKPLTTAISRSPGSKALFQRWYGLGALKPGRSGTVTAVFDVHFDVQFRFVDLKGKAVPRDNVGSVAIKSSVGVMFELPRATSQTEFRGSRVVPLNGTLQSKPVYYTVQSVMVGGNNLVNRSQVKFFPGPDRVVTIELQYYPVEVRVRDALFGWSSGETLVITSPSGEVQRRALHKGRVALPALPRGDYQMTVEGAGIPLGRPVSMSRPQTVDLKLLSFVDIAAVIGGGLLFALGLVLVGRRFPVPVLVRRPPR